MALKEDIRAKALEFGFTAAGFAAPAAAPETGERLRAALAQGFHGTMAWMEERVGWRSDPAALWPEARSVIMLAEAYTPVVDPLAVLLRA